MASLNKVFLIGNLTRDPELRVLPKGTAVCQFGLAVNREFKGDDGAKKEEVTFIDCEAWGKTAELVAKYLGKGSQCMVEGRLKLDEWTDKTSGQKRSRLKVVLENVQFLGSKRDAAPAAEQEPETYTDMKPQAAPAAARTAQQEDADVPY